MQKHQHNLLVCFCIAVMLFANSLSAQFSGGTGTETDPFQIKTPADLSTIRNYIGDTHTGRYFKLMNDLDLTEYLASNGAGYNNGAFWSPISSVDAAMFRGKFDGSGFAIKNLKINLPTVDNTGLFGYLGAGAEIKNVNLINADVKGKNATGILIGANRGGSIINSSSSGQVSGAQWVGGLVGFHESNGVNGLISNCYSTAAVSCSGSAAGGLAGQNGALSPGNSIIENSYATGSVSCVDHAGGLIGHQNGNGIVRNCYASGKPTNSGDPANKGGLAGFAQGSVTDSYWDKESSGISTSAGSDPSFGKTTAEMKAQTTYAGWDFTGIWHFSSTEFNGYPHLAWQIHLTFAGGTGTSSDPFLITTADQLNNVRNYLGSAHADKYFKLMNDLDMSPYLSQGGNGYTLWGASGWLPIGGSNYFYGKFDGNGHIISNLVSNRSTESDLGLFGSLRNSSIKSLGLVNANIRGKYNCAVLSSLVTGASTISDIYVTGSLQGTSTVGAIASRTLDAVVIENCYSWVNITSQYGIVGGITGTNNNTLAQINNCYSTGKITVSSGSDIGGLNGAGGTVNNSYWDKESTTRTTSAGSDAALYGKTTAEMKTQSTYTNWFTNGKWHFSANQNYGYPHLAWQVFNDATPPQITAVTGTEAKAGVPLNITVTAVDESNIASVQGFYRLEGESNWTALVMSAVSGTDNFTATIPAQTTAKAGKVKFIVTDYGYPTANSLQSREYFIGWSLGSGTASDPYQIYRAEDLVKLHNYTALPNAAELNYKVMCDFDLSSYLSAGGDGYLLWGDAGWLPIGGDSYGFTGKFDGNGHKITGLKANRSESSWFLGLFSIVQAGAVVKNLGVETDPAASMTGVIYVGIIAGNSFGSITNCYTTGKVEATRANAGLAGGISGNNSGLISNCYSTAEVKSVNYAGGITSYNYDGGNIVNCYAAGKITCSYYYTGGVVGRNHPNATISGCYWDVEATGVEVSYGSDPAIYGKTTKDMHSQNSFAGWDFTNTWRIADGSSYPYLKWENPGFLAGSYTVGTNGDFSSLTGTGGFFAAVNSKNIIGNLTANIISDLNETGATALNQWTESGAGNYTLTIQPGNGTLRTISGSAGVNSALIRLNGADRVTIDGQTGKLLTFVNSNPTAGDAGAVIGLDNGSDNCTVTNCNISNSNTASTAITGIAIGNANGVKISKNKISNLNGNASATVTGIKYNGAASALTGTIANNMISLIPTTTGIVSGISYAGNVQNSLDLYYNSIHIGGTQSGSNHSYGFFKSTDAANLNIKNNIFHNARTNSTGTGKHYAVALVNTVGTVTEDYNLLYSASNFAGLYGSADKVTLANWISDTPYDDNSKSSVIQFENESAGNLAFKRLAANSAVFNTGVVVSGISEDFFGKARPQYGREDIGAYELPQSSGLEENILPFETNLAQNYPNPFNPVTAINYELRIADNVKLAVFNAKGEMVKTLVNGMQNAGRYSVNFDGAGFNSGVYFYKLEADGKNIVKRMLLVK